MEREGEARERQTNSSNSVAFSCWLLGIQQVYQKELERRRASGIRRFYANRCWSVTFV